jgi:hypothetical protein
VWFERKRVSIRRPLKIVTVIWKAFSHFSPHVNYAHKSFWQREQISSPLLLSHQAKAGSQEPSEQKGDLLVTWPFRKHMHTAAWCFLQVPPSRKVIALNP